MREVRTLEICSNGLSVDAIIIKKPGHMAYDVLLQTHTQSPDLFDQHLDVTLSFLVLFYLSPNWMRA